MKTNKYILFTGAGFTHNFGTPLAKEMWAEIFNSDYVQSGHKIKKLMLNTFDYENIYYKITEGKEYLAKEKKAILDAVLNAYNSIDNIVLSYISKPNSPIQINSYSIQHLINEFANQQHKSYFFTINQDLFIERHYSNNQPAFGKLQHLGIKNASKWFPPIFNRPLRVEDYIPLPSQTELDKIKDETLSHKGFYYIKLHGSHNWLDSNGNRQIVIGRGKSKQISKEPLLKWYFEMFKKALFQPNIKLLIIGYGFNDSHINQIIIDSCLKYGLQIYIISPQPIKHFQEYILSEKTRKPIWNNLTGYFPYTLAQMFPIDNSSTQYRKNLYKHLFNKNLR